MKDRIRGVEEGRFKLTARARIYYIPNSTRAKDSSPKKHIYVSQCSAALLMALEHLGMIDRQVLLAL